MRFTETMTPEEETGVAQLAVEVQEQVDVRGTWVMDDGAELPSFLASLIPPGVSVPPVGASQTLADPRRPSQTLADLRIPSHTLAYPRL
jgi:hypothetical protein